MVSNQIGLATQERYTNCAALPFASVGTTFRLSAVIRCRPSTNAVIPSSGCCRRVGKFEHADGGTLFLDEIGDMPLPLQAKLLRVLENEEIFRLGSNEPIKVNVRLISATQRDLEPMVAEGKFRQDLLFPAQGGDGQAAAAARRARTSRCWPLTSSRSSTPSTASPCRHCRAGAQGDGGLRLARQCPRAAQLHRELVVQDTTA